MTKAWRLSKVAWRSIHSHPLRSTLTSFGIVAGVAAIVMVASIAEGTRKDVALSIEGLGANRLDVNSGTTQGQRNALLPFGGLYQLTDQDVLTVEGIHGVASVSGFLRGSVEISKGQAKVLAAWVGGNDDAAQVLGYTVEAGRALTSAEANGVRRVVLIGASTASKLFDEGPAVGARVRVGGTSFTVIGVLARRGMSISGQDLDDVVLLPIEAARRHLMGNFPLPNKAVQQIGVRVHDVATIDVVQARIQRQLRAVRKLSASDSEDFYITSVASTVQSRSQADKSMAYLLLSVAAICLVVGGIGVMNIMLVSITERTGEIGLRMAVGASPSDIRAQFLLEATLLSVLGGLLGIIFGVGGSAIIASHRDIFVEVNFWVVLTGFVATAGTGICFGILPADRAARLPPADALRRL